MALEDGRFFRITSRLHKKKNLNMKNKLVEKWIADMIAHGFMRRWGGDKSEN